MWIANFSKANIKAGLHFAPNNNTILIQIQDAFDFHFVKSPYQNEFVEVYQFNFWDEEDGTQPQSITDEQAALIAKALRDAYNNQYNVVVHCHAGICRSGAVAEAGVLLGFTVPDGLNKRIPNVLVFNKVRKALGILYSWEL